MSVFSCNPLEFVQSLTKAQRKALKDILQFRCKGDVIGETRQRAMERAN